MGCSWPAWVPSSWDFVLSEGSILKSLESMFAGIRVTRARHVFVAVERFEFNELGGLKVRSQLALLGWLEG